MTGTERFVIECNKQFAGDADPLARTFSNSKDRAIEKAQKMRDTVMERGEAVVVRDKATGEVIWQHIASAA